MTPWAPLIMVGGFLLFGLTVVICDEVGQAMKRWAKRRARKRDLRATD